MVWYTNLTKQQNHQNIDVGCRKEERKKKNCVKPISMNVVGEQHDKKDFCHRLINLILSNVVVFLGCLTTQQHDVCTSELICNNSCTSYMLLL